MRVLFLGEIVGKAGLWTVKTELRRFGAERNVDFVIANANGATGGFGVGKNHAITLNKRGIDVLTAGEYVFNKKDMVEYIGYSPFVLRPANLPPEAPGRGWAIFPCHNVPVAVISLLGQSGYHRIHADNPFEALPQIVERLRNRAKCIILNFHATTSAEKRTMAFHSEGLVSAMIGTGTRCLTADAQLMNGGTAVITDAGRTGSRASIYGMESETERRILVNRIPERSKDGWGDLRLQGVMIDINDSGSATSVEAIDIPCKEEPDDSNGTGS